MPNITQTITNLRAAISRDNAADILKNCIGVPSPASVREMLSVVRTSAAMNLTAAETNALALLEQFGTRPGAIKFTRLQRGLVAIQLLARVLQPGLVNQGAFGMCGPAAVAIDTARNNPLGYVTFAISLCENSNGNIGGRMVTPVAGILNYDLGTAMPQADWVVLASLRDDNASLQGDFNRATYGGSTCDEVFDWLVRCGFQKVLALSHLTLANSFRAHPISLLPPTLSSSTKLKTLETAADLSSRGWRIFMLGFMQLATGIERTKAISDMEAMIGAPMPVQRAAVVNSLLTPNPGPVGTIVNVFKGLVGLDGGDTRHWTYVESLVLTPGAPGTVTITCCNHGVRYPAVTLPLDAFVNKFLGCVAVTDYA